MRQPQYTYIGTSLGNILRKFVDLIPWENKSTQQFRHTTEIVLLTAYN